MASINSIANLGGFAGPYGTGALKTMTNSNYAGFYAIAAIKNKYLKATCAIFERKLLLKF